MEFKYIDLNKAGTNQHARKVRSITILGITLKAKVWANIIIIFMMLLILGVIGYFTQGYRKQISMMSSGYKVYAQTVERPYTEPTLADETTQEQMIAVIKKVWRRDWETGVAIAKCESGLRPNAFNGSNTNGTWDAGLMQVNSIHGISKEDLFNPYANAGYAYSIYKEQGLQPWYSSNGCHHLLD